MTDQFYADGTRVTMGEQFSTDFRYLRLALVTDLVTYLQVGPTFRSRAVSDNPANPKVWAYSCGPYQLRNTYAGTTSEYPVNEVQEVAL
jgi:hypothetical protein